MFLNIFLLFSTITYTIVVGTKCTEYMIIIPEDLTCALPRIADINWDGYDCPHTSTDILTYEEFKANRSCVIEFACNNVETFCPHRAKRPPYNKYSLRPNTSIKDRFDMRYTERIESEKNNDNSPSSKCNTSTDGFVCKDYKQKNMKEEVNHIENKINLIYDIDNIIENSSEAIDFNKWIYGTKAVMNCNYTDKICMGNNYTTFNNNVTTDINTIIVSVTKTSVNNPSMKYNINTKDITNLRCQDFNDKDILNQLSISLIHDIIALYHCKNNTFHTDHNNLLSTKNYTYDLNVYLTSERNVDNTNDIKCMQNFMPVTEQIVKVECESLEIPEINDTVNKNVDDNTTYLSNSLIWNCNFPNPEFPIVCDHLQSQKYKLLNFLNCTNDDANKTKLLKSNINITKHDVIVNLMKVDVDLESKKTQHKKIRNGSFSENFQIHFISNESKCNESLSSFDINEGRLFNMWTNDEEMTISRHFNSFLIELNLSNCITYNSTIKLNNDTKSNKLKLDIILNKQNSTSSYLFQQDNLNDAKENTNRAIINCLYPHLENISSINNSNIDLKLKLECEYQDTKEINADIDYSTNTESYTNDHTLPVKLKSPEDAESRDIEENQDNETMEGNKTNNVNTNDQSKITDASSKLKSFTDVNSGPSTESYTSKITISVKLTSPEDATNPEIEENQRITMERNKTNILNPKGQSQLAGVSPKNNEDTSHYSPLFYITVVLATICVIAIAAIIGVKIWKPSYKYTPVPMRSRRVPRNREESSL